ncbi:hypothetical protein F9B77_05915 [Staphylococcus epidermidis]|uniref:hypothetical protein n=1 Tax=Staphylococcus epidermidis TaxID=1282 RepID=UPI00026BF351|nr:hypothetical protein [Staphylococcus epidermidis]EJD84675.1 hypothetical protein HMPREF9991_10676 [Staphylococcus epidermidis NIHLM067]EJD93289.1 hypothetical protein HMPREF9987_10483 [Staphylococcus epidermidis NIHLM049]EJE09207.1 hypothetical protein HMPREF9981_10282 [Staphylococcus epidermidis NIHLM020]EJE27522.1 hypothetical protein HMPREF9974_05068 [Staphylococcus epidermidis NIH05005]EJE31894.1 hypothetical protein HMPREF9973_08118 [Staphylococcus epidermidis NIH05001]EJE38719.1 hypo
MAKTNKSGTRIFYVPDLLYVYTDSYEMSPTQRISEEIPRTKQVGVGAPTERISEEIPRTKQVGVGEKTGDNEFYPSLAFILIRGILQS